MKKVATYTFSIFFLIIIVLFGSIYQSDIPLDELKSKYTNEQSRFMTLDSMQVHYRIEGQGFPLVLLHGTAASLHTWDEWTKSLEDTFQIVRMDLPAFGLTGPNKTNQYSIPIYLDFVEDFLDELGVQEFYLAGNSLGGNIAWNFASRHPERVKKLILIDAAGIPRKKIVSAIKIAQNPVGGWLLQNTLPKIFIKKNMKEVYFDDTKVTDELVDRYFHMALREGNRSAFVSRARTNMVLTEPDFSHIQCPTLILWGEYDEWIPVGDAYLFNKQIANSQVIIYDKAGHVPMEEIPEITAQDTRKFLLDSIPMK